MPSLSDRVRDNIHAIEELKEEAQRDVTPHQLLIERTAYVLARPVTLAVLLGAVVTWVTVNLLVEHPLDRAPFFWMQGALALYGAVVTTMILIAQTRQRREEDRRAHLELHVNLLAEQKTTKLISLIEELRRDLPMVRNRPDPEAVALAEQVDPKTVHSAIDRETGKKP